MYHVQTEDGGTDNPVIVSLVYQGGRILASRKTSYAKLMGTESMSSRLRDLLENQHKQMIKAILTGTLGSAQGKGPATEPATAVIQASPDKLGSTVEPRSSTDVVQSPANASEKNLDQVILEYLASEIDND